jgi:hypothetical protein
MGSYMEIFEARVLRKQDTILNIGDFSTKQDEL